MRALVSAAIVFMGTLMAAVAAGPAQGPLNLTGTWSGTASDYWVNQVRTDGMRVTWELTQSGASVSGTVTSTNLTAMNDGSCSGCHRTKGGTVSGTVSGNSLSLTMTFPGTAGEITPHCSSTFSGTAAPVTATDLTLAYSGSDSCEGPFTQGSLVMSAGPPSAPAISSQPLSQAVVAGRPATLGVNTPGTPPLSYQWYRGISGVTTDPVVGATASSLVTAPVTQTVRYWVRVSNFFGAVDSAAAELAVALGFIDDLLTEQVSGVRAVHIMELRTRINAARASAGLSPTTFSDGTLTAQQTVVRAAHIAELRSSLSEVYTARLRAVPTFTHASLGGVTVRRIHIDELRAAVAAIE